MKKAGIEIGREKNGMREPLPHSLQDEQLVIPVAAEHSNADAIRNNPGYFTQLQSAGAVIEAHTITHTDLKGKSYAFQRHEICVRDPAGVRAAARGDRPSGRPVGCQPGDAA